MPARFETLYKWLKRTPVTDDELNKRFRDVDDRFNALEVLKIAWEEALKVVEDRVLGQSELVIASLRDQLLAITQLQWLVAESATEITFVEDATRAIAIVEADRQLFAPGPFSIVSSIEDPDVYAVVETLAYDRDLGQYDFRVLSFEGGAGPHGPFQVAAVAGSTLAQVSMLGESRGIRDEITHKVALVDADRVAAQQAAQNAAADRSTTAGDRAQTGIDKTAAAASAASAALFRADPIDAAGLPPVADFIFSSPDAIDPAWLTRASVGYRRNSAGLLLPEAANVLRIDHDGTTGARRGALLEGAGTNRHTWSEDFSNAIYSKVAGTLAAQGAAFVESATSAAHYFASAVAAVVSGNTYAVSLDVKPAGRTRFILRGNGASFTAGILVNLGTMTATTYTGGAIPFPVRDLGNGEYRVGFSGVAVSTGTVGIVFQLLDDVGGSNYLGDGVKGIIPLRLQIEDGVVPTSYVKTTTAIDTRAADSLIIPPADFATAWNAAEGTIFIEGRMPDAVSPLGQNLWQADDGTEANRIRVVRDSLGNFYCQVNTASVSQAVLNFGTPASSTTFRLALAWKLNDFAASLNGAAVLTDTAGTVPVVDRERLGAGVGGAAPWNGHIARVARFGRRIPNSNLQAMAA